MHLFFSRTARVVANHYSRSFVYREFVRTLIHSWQKAHAHCEDPQLDAALVIIQAGFNDNFDGKVPVLRDVLSFMGDAVLSPFKMMTDGYPESCKSYMVSLYLLTRLTYQNA